MNKNSTAWNVFLFLYFLFVCFLFVCLLKVKLSRFTRKYVLPNTYGGPGANIYFTLAKGLMVRSQHE